MTRVLSALVLLPAVLGIAWFLHPIYTTILLGIIVVLAFDEYARMAKLGSEGFPRVIGGVATLAVYVGVWAGVPLALVFAPALLVGAAAAVGRGRPDEDAVRLAAVTLFPLLYLAVPLGLALSKGLDDILRTMPGIPINLHFFVFEPRALAWHGGLLAVTAVAAALYPMRLVATLPIASTLRDEVVS